METKDKILIVEDDETIAAFLIAVLEANGFDTIRASLGREAVTLISSHCPDLVLLDLSLPDMDGMEILAGLRKWSTLPVIVVSARGRERDKVIALDMGADDYLTKPFGPGELLARIRAALRHVRTAAGGEVGRTGVYRCGDLEVDCHHTIEDTGIVLGQAIRKAVGDKKGIVRYGTCILPMDESLVLCSLDLSGRPYYVSDVEFPTERVGEMDTQMVKEFFYAVSYSAAMNLHFKMLSGGNSHHMIEGMFKAFAKALDMATGYDERIDGVLSTKGSL